MIERHITFEVMPGNETAFESTVKQWLAWTRERPCCFANSWLLREQPQPTHFHIVLRFDSPELAAAWSASTEHNELSPKIKPLFSKASAVSLDVVG